MEWLIGHWNSEEYSHAILIPVVGAYMTLLNQPARGQSRPGSRYWGVALLSLAVLILLLAHYGKMISLYGLSLLAMTYGLFLVLAGWETVRQNCSALLLLTFMVPLPTALFNGMSNSLQLVSSGLGAWMIELFGITVHLEGNIIDIGIMQMQVVEACSGLRYLLPLIALAYIESFPLSTYLPASPSPTSNLQHPNACRMSPSQTNIGVETTAGYGCAASVPILGTC